jgi:hypothetical protein
MAKGNPPAEAAQVVKIHTLANLFRPSVV